MQNVGRCSYVRDSDIDSYKDAPAHSYRQRNVLVYRQYRYCTVVSSTSRLSNGSDSTERTVICDRSTVAGEKGNNK